MSLTISTSLNAPFDDTVARTRQALADQGFGILTEIDVTATLKTKIDQDIENYLILGACNPHLAHRALEVDRQVGSLLPCNVVIRSDPSHPGTTIVEATNPSLMVEATTEPALEPIARDASDKLTAALNSL